MQMDKDFNWDHVAYFEHYKGGKYTMLDTMAWLEEDMDKDISKDDKRLIIYRCLKTGEVYARRKSLFFGNVTVDGITQPRFRSVTWREAALINHLTGERVTP